MTEDAHREAVDRLCERDVDLGQVVRRFGPPPLWRREPGFLTLIRIVLEQQVSLASGRATFERLREAAGDVSPSAVVVLGVDGLRAAGITRQKSSYLYGIAEKVLAGELDLGEVARSDDSAARDMLMQLRGVGRWTADIYLLMALGRPDVWPRGDLALVSALRELKDLSTDVDAESAEALAEKWAPWRSTAAKILWHHYLSTRSNSAERSRDAGSA